MSREADCRRMRGVIRALAREGCDERFGRSLPISRIAEAARIKPEAAKTTIKTLRRRGWLIRVHFNVSGNVYRLSAPPEELLKMTRNTQATAPSHYDALIAATVEAENTIKEALKKVRSVRKPEGMTEHSVAEELLAVVDHLQEVADRLVFHAAEHCGLNGQSDFVNDAKRAAKEAEAKAKEAEVVDVEAEPLFGDDEVDGSAEALPESPIGLEWSGPGESYEDEDEDDDDSEGVEGGGDERGAA